MVSMTDLEQRLGNRLGEVFGITDVHEVELMQGGLLCENFSIRAGTQRYFLKQYRKQTSTWVYEIKFAEQYFAENDIPVILPITDRHGRTAFWFEDNWYSLFPFIEGIQKDADALTLDDVQIGRAHV